MTCPPETICIRLADIGAATMLIIATLLVATLIAMAVVAVARQS